jgi:GNAT superfamily N-acetyltransferase
MPSDFLYQEATSADVPAMARCRAADPDAGPADERMARYLDGAHDPQQALPPRTAFMALSGGDVVGYIAGHATTRLLPPSESEYLGSEYLGSDPMGSDPMGSDPMGSDPTVSDATVSDPDAVKWYGCEGEVQYLYVAPQARRHGVAAQLLQLLAEWFNGRGIRRVCVNVDVESAGAAPFYLAARARPLNRHWYVWDDIRSVSSADGDDRGSSLSK